MKISNVGEFGAIDHLTRLILERRQRTPAPPGSALLVDTGDDAAAWQSPAGSYLFTTDTMVEGVHFTEATLSWEDVGWKVMAVNASDLAAMGGHPLYALVTLGLPAEFPLSALDLLYEGALSMAEEAHFAIIGGDMVKSPTTFVTVALVGTIRGAPMTRRAASPGHLVAVTGPLGSSAGGLALLQGKGEVDVEPSPNEPVRPTDVDADAKVLLQSHRRPQPHLTQGRILAEEGVSCAMDVSDGLIADLSKLCRSSGVAAQISAHRLPMIPALPHCFPETCRQKALSGGEDYILLFTAPPDTMNQVLDRIPEAAVIGCITGGEPGQVTVLDQDGKDVTPSQSGWDHYR